MLKTILKNQRVILEALRDGIDTGWILSEIDKRIEATSEKLVGSNMNTTTGICKHDWYGVDQIHSKCRNCGRIERDD
jgi:nucleosome binding factor SPN SPT16 subunit